MSNITPVYKDDDSKLVSNYHPISLLSIPSKLLERIIHNKLMNHLLSNSIISRQQFGFRPQSSTQEALLAATNDWHQYLDSNLSVGCVAFDLSKAFNSLPHPTILSNLSEWASVVDYSIGSKTIFPTGNRRLFWMDTSPPQLGCLRSPSRVYFGPPTFHHLHGPNYQFISIERL